MKKDKEEEKDNKEEDEEDGWEHWKLKKMSYSSLYTQAAVLPDRTRSVLLDFWEGRGGARLQTISRHLDQPRSTSQKR